MTKNRIISLLFIVLFSGTIFAQNDLQNMKKYWWYRHRLINDFLIKGDFQGGSIPFNQRAFSTPTSGIAYWGDGTIALSQYISVLATEFKLLEQQGQPTDSTIEELYYAIKALNRLDRSAEANIIFPPHTIPVAADLNGFFIRDDIPSNFLTDPNHLKLSQGTVSNKVVTNVLSDFSSINPRDKEMSHDQIWHVYTGLALVRKYLYSGISYQGKPLNDLNYNSDIWQEAQDISDRIITRIKDDSWVINNPNTGTVVPRGPYVQELSYGAAEAACYIKNVNTNLDPGFPVHTCTDYHNFLSYLDGNLWMDYGRGYGTLIAFSAEDFKVQTLAAIGNSWWTSTNPFLPDPITVLTILFDPTNFLHPFTTLVSLVTAILPIPPINVTVAELGVRTILRDYQHLSLLRQVLHGGSNPIPNSTYRNIIDTAPGCGPFNYDYPANSSSFEWSTDSRLLYPDRRGENSSGVDNIANFYGEFNGLDYMMYYNLYQIIAGSSVPTVNYMDRRVTTSFPITIGSGSSSTLVGTIANPVTVEGFSSLTSSSVLNSNAGVTYRGGYEVNLKPGFVATAGSNFTAYVEPFTCSGDGTYRASTNDSTDSATEYLANNAQAFNGQTTFVNYPRRDEYSETQPEQSSSNGITENNEAIATNSSSNISNVSSNSFLSIIPNPNSGSFQIKITSNNQAIGIKEMKIMNMMGNIVWSSGPSENNLFIVDISVCSPGIYYVQSINSLGELEVKKLIKK